uniref:HECT domain-containing protein n=1 Tax=Amphimedon queenslandica TaxID=400682 RepID=A0A1X7U889_AMPQE
MRPLQKDLSSVPVDTAVADVKEKFLKCQKLTLLLLLEEYMISCREEHLIDFKAMLSKSYSSTEDIIADFDKILSRSDMPVTISNDRIIQDSFQLIKAHPHKLSCCLLISFAGEEGCDAGGLCAEYWAQLLTSLKEMF